MRIRILGIADGLPQADQLLRSLERSGYSIDEVTVLLACAEERDAQPRPAVCEHLPATLASWPASISRTEAGSIVVTGQPAFYGVALADGSCVRAGARTPTVTANARIEAHPSAGIVRDLQALGVDLAQASRIALTVRVHNVLVLVEERPGGDGDAIVSCMLEACLPIIHFMAEAAAGQAPPSPGDDGEEDAGRGRSARPSWRTMPYF
jgi:hypothetical protein